MNWLRFWNVVSWLVFWSVLIFVLLFCISTITGCSHQQQVINKYYDPDTGNLIKAHDIISSTSVLYWSKFKALEVKRDDIYFTVAGVERKPELSQIVKALELLGWTTTSYLEEDSNDKN
jgi:uncharacterized membrane protein